MGALTRPTRHTLSLRPITLYSLYCRTYRPILPYHNTTKLSFRTTMFTHTTSNYSRRLAGFTSVVALLCFTTQCAADMEIVAARVCSYIKKQDHNGSCNWCFRGVSNVHKEGTISAVRANSKIKYFVFTRKTENGGLKTDNFKVHQVLGPEIYQGEWLQLILKGHGFMSKNIDRWFKVSKSIDFLKCLLTEEGALTYTDCKFSKRYIKEAIDEYEEDTSSPEPVSFLGECRKAWDNYREAKEEERCKTCHDTGLEPCDDKKDCTNDDLLHACWNPVGQCMRPCTRCEEEEEVDRPLSRGEYRRKNREYNARKARNAELTTD